MYNCPRQHYPVNPFLPVQPRHLIGLCMVDKSIPDNPYTFTLVSKLCTVDEVTIAYPYCLLTVEGKDLSDMQSDTLLSSLHEYCVTIVKEGQYSWHSEWRDEKYTLTLTTKGSYYKSSDSDIGSMHTAEFLWVKKYNSSNPATRPTISREGLRLSGDVLEKLIRDGRQLPPHQFSPSCRYEYKRLSLPQPTERPSFSKAKWDVRRRELYLTLDTPTWLTTDDLHNFAKEFSFANTWNKTHPYERDSLREKAQELMFGDDVMDIINNSILDLPGYPHCGGELCWNIGDGHWEPLQLYLVYYKDNRKTRGSRCVEHSGTSWMKNFEQFSREREWIKIYNNLTKDTRSSVIPLLEGLRIDNSPNSGVACLLRRYDALPDTQ